MPSESYLIPEFGYIWVILQFCGPNCLSMLKVFIHAIQGWQNRRMSVENLWMRIKRNLRCQLGTSSEMFPSYLYEFIFRNKFRNDDFFVVYCVLLLTIMGFEYVTVLHSEFCDNYQLSVMRNNLGP